MSEFEKDSAFAQEAERRRIGLVGWDPSYDHTKLAENFTKLDAHDMKPGRGVQIPSKEAAGKTLTAKEAKRLRDILNECDDIEERCFDIVQEGLDILR